MNLILIIIGVVLVNNFVLARFLGICPFLGVSRQTDTALGMGLAVIFVMTIASVVTWGIQRAFLVIAALVQLVEIVVQKVSPTLYQGLGIYLPLITTNCAVLGVSILNIQRQHSFTETLVFGFGASVGFTLALLLFAGLRERIALADVPRAFRGTAIALITAGLLSLAFMGFSGLVK